MEHWKRYSMLWNNKKEGQTAAYSMEDLPKLVQQTVLLVGHTNATLSFHRRLNALDDIMTNSTKAKSMLNMKSDLLQKIIKIFSVRISVSNSQRQWKHTNKLLTSTVSKEAHGIAQPFFFLESIFYCSGQSSAEVWTTVTVVDGITGTEVSTNGTAATFSRRFHIFTFLCQKTHIRRFTGKTILHLTFYQIFESISDVPLLNMCSYHNMPGQYADYSQVSRKDSS